MRRTQLTRQLPPALWAEAERTLAALERGHVNQAVPPGLEALFRASVQPYLASWLAADPAADLAACMAWPRAHRLGRGRRADQRRRFRRAAPDVPLVPGLADALAALALAQCR